MIANCDHCYIHSAPLSWAKFVLIRADNLVFVAVLAIQGIEK